MVSLGELFQQGTAREFQVGQQAISSIGVGLQREKEEREAKEAESDKFLGGAIGAIASVFTGGATDALGLLTSAVTGGYSGYTAEGNLGQKVLATVNDAMFDVGTGGKIRQSIKTAKATMDFIKLTEQGLSPMQIYDKFPDIVTRAKGIAFVFGLDKERNSKLEQLGTATQRIEVTPENISEFSKFGIKTTGEHDITTRQDGSFVKSIKYNPPVSARTFYAIGDLNGNIIPPELASQVPDEQKQVLHVQRDDSEPGGLKILAVSPRLTPDQKAALGVKVANFKGLDTDKRYDIENTEDFVASTQKVGKMFEDAKSIVMNPGVGDGWLGGSMVTFKTFAGQLGVESEMAELSGQYDVLRARVGELARGFSGEKGVLTDQDAKRAADALPNFYDSDSRKRGKLMAAQKILNDAIVINAHKNNIPNPEKYFVTFADEFIAVKNGGAPSSTMKPTKRWNPETKRLEEI